MRLSVLLASAVPAALATFVFNPLTQQFELSPHWRAKCGCPVATPFQFAPFSPYRSSPRGFGRGFQARSDEAATGGILGGILTGPTYSYTDSDPGKRPDEAYGRGRLDFESIDDNSVSEQKGHSSGVVAQGQKALVDVLTIGNRLDVSHVASDHEKFEMNTQ